MINQMQIIMYPNEILYNAVVSKSNLGDYNDDHILVRGNIFTAAPNITTQVTFKNYTPFTKCITKIDRTTIGDDEHLHLVMLMHDLIEYTSNYSETTGSLWFYSKDEASNFNADIAKNNSFKLFEHKSKLL